MTNNCIHIMKLVLIPLFTLFDLTVFCILMNILNETKDKQLEKFSVVLGIVVFILLYLVGGY